MSNPQLSILWGERLMGGGESVQGKLITSTRKIKIKKKIVIIKKKVFLTLTFQISPVRQQLVKH